MENKGEIYHLWLQYRAKNEEEYFCMFVHGFVSIWEDILDLSWSTFPDWVSVKPDSGPHLDRLPEELLPTVSRFMQVARKQTEENSLNCEVLSEVEHLVRLLTVIARNFDNIPLVASCDYVSTSVSLAAAVIHQLVEESAHYGEAGFAYFVSLCRFLEVLYDPYFTWRHFLQGSEADYSKLTFQPALLHVEVIPFIYDCFRTNLVDNYPDLGSELLHVLGAAVAGAQHNALRAICPATASILMAVLRPSYPAQLRHTALQCFVLMVRVLLRSSPDQRQIEVGTLLQQLLGIIQSVSGESWSPDSLHSLTQMVSALRSLLTAPETPNAAIANHAAIIVTQVQQAMIDNQVIKALLSLLRRGAQEEGDKQSLAVEIVGTVSMFLNGNNLTKDRFRKANGYNKLLEALKALGQPRRPLLKALVAMSTEECSDNVPNEGSKLKNGEALMLCFKWLPEVSQVDQVWLAETLSCLCTASLQSRVLSCGHSVILTTCSLLEMGASLPRPVAGELLGLLENLASHSITPRELKQVFLLLRDGSDDEKCPYRSHLLRVISTVARRSDYGDCHFFFDVQNDTDGLSVPGIRKWSGAGYGFTFHCWVKLEADSSSDNSGDVSPATPATPSTPSTPVTPGTPATPLRNISSDSSSRRRQLFTLLTSSNTGMEAFFRSDGILVVGLSTKKEFISATVPEPALNDDHWHCIQISLMTARRPFGHNQLAVFIDGAQKLSASMKFPTMAEPFTYCTIGSVVQRGTTNAPSPSCDTSGRRGSSSGGLIPSLINQVPSYFSLPLPLRSSSQLAPHVKSFQAGLENMLFGPAGPIRGQLGLCALLHDALTPQHARLLHQSGCNSRALFVTDSSAPAEFQDMTNRLVFCFSPAACWNNLCLDLAPGNKYDGHVVATQCQTLNIKTAINGIGGIHVLFPILEGSADGDGGPDLSLLTSAPPLMRVTASGTGTIARKASDDLDDWEVLPSSSYSDSKLEVNPASGFISLLRNLLCGSALNQEQLLKNNGAAILGDLLSKVRPQLLDVNVLMAVQLLVEMARDVDNPALLRALHQHVLFNFRIWSRGPFHIRIGHIQYISSVIKEDRKSFRKRYGVSFFLDTIRQYHASTVDLLGAEDSRSLRHAILGLIKYYIGKEVNVREVGSIISFLCSVKEEILVFELLEMLIVHLEGHCMDQLYLLLFEPLSAELLYCLLADSKFTMELKQKVVKLISVLLRSERIYERHKARLRLHDTSVLGIRSSPSMGMYPGLVSQLYEQTLSMEVVNMLLDQMLMTENHSSYAGVLSLLHLLSSAELDIKVEAARKVLTTLYMRPTAAATFAKQTGWQDCVSRLLIKRPISSAVSIAEEATDLMTFEDDLLDLDRVGGSRSPSSVSRLSASVSDAAYVLENEIKEVAERASHAVADNIHYAADNLSSVMASAYSVFKQKTVEMQESLEEFGESVQRLKTRHSLPSLSESPRSSRTGDSISIDTRSESDSSDDDMSCSGQSTDLSTGSGSSSLSQGPPSIEVVDSQTDEQREMAEALKEWQTLEASKEWDRQDDLTYFVLHILFMIFWNGVDSNSRDAWKERGEVMAGINLLALNNELYSSHLQLKLRLLEMAVTAVLSDLREASTSPSPTSSSIVNRIENAQQLLRWVYDLSVLDPNSDCSKKMSVKLLDGVLGILDVLPVFQEGLPEEKSDLAKLALAILLSAAASSQQDVCAMATAKLHALVCTRRHADTKETAYLLYRIDDVVRQSCREHYTFLIPVVKALVEKIQKPLSLADHCPGCVSGNDFFEDFPKNQESDEWKTLIEKEVKPLYSAFEQDVITHLTEAMNVFWAECYEAYKVGVHRRTREAAGSKALFQEQIVNPFRARQSEDISRYSNRLAQQRNREVVVQRQWRTLKRFFVGPRGAWKARRDSQRHWILSKRENSSRMRLKLTPILDFDAHTDASNLRDNSGGPNQRRSSENPLPLAVCPAAVRTNVEDDVLPEEDLRSLQAETEQEASRGRASSADDKLLLAQDCELVTLMSAMRGRLEVYASRVAFIDLSPPREDCERHDFTWPLSRLREMHLRRYNLRRSGLEFFLLDQTNYFLNFSPKTRNKVFSRILSARPPNLLMLNSRSPAEMLRSSGLTQKWVNREISNFDYLMQLNTIAGRSYNDLSQYPVFPWVLADYSSNVLDLDNPASFRDLSKPIGVVNPKNVPEVKAKYEHFEDPSGVIAKFHYGTHYSNSAGVLHYLVRVEPFTSLHIELQSGRFDVADRQFHSIPQTWKLLMDNPNDVKELTPEFFYFPEFLKNINSFDLGLLQGTKERVEDVILPKWASSPEDFIYKHRRALESEYVSAHLHEWIDLIFGCKQKGPKAVEALNVFYYCSYEGAVDLDALESAVEREALEGMINNFGQTPCQLLREAHPPRPSEHDAAIKRLRTDLTTHLDRVVTLSMLEVGSERDPLVFVSPPRAPPRTFLGPALPDVVVTVSRAGVVGSHAWSVRSVGNLLEVEQGPARGRPQRCCSPAHPLLPVSSRLMCLSPDGRFLLTGGHWDCSLRGWSIARAKVIFSIVRHFDVVTCVALDRQGLHLVTGSRDSTCVVWEWGDDGGAAIPPPPRPVQTLYGHDSSVVCVAIMSDLDIVVSGSKDLTVNVHSISDGQYLHTLEPVGCSGLDAEVTFLALSSHGDVAFAVSESSSHSVHVFSINGAHMGSKYVSGRVTGLAVAGDKLIVVDDAGDLTMSRLYGLRPVFDMPLHAPVQTLEVTPGNSHILIALRDGKLAVIGVAPSTSVSADA